MDGRDDGQARFHVLSLSGVDSRVRDYRRRKVHEKSPSGCFSCKAKKVKCDESRPACARCRRNSRPCAYGQPRNDHKDSGPWCLVADGEGVCRLSVLSAVTVDPFASPSAQNGTSTMYLMQHFQKHQAEIFHMPRSHEIISFSQSHSLVRSTVLAIAACHLRHVSPGVRQHRIAEHFQQSLALQDYQRALDTPRMKLCQSNVDALLLSAALLNILAFALPASETAGGGGGGGGGGELDPSTSWVFSPREDRLSWLALQTGLKSLVKSTAAYLDQTMTFLGPIFLGADKESWAFGGVGVGRDLVGVPARWIEVFELDGTVDGGCDGARPGSAVAVDAPENVKPFSAATTPSGVNRSDVFRAPVTILAKLRNLEPVRVNVYQNLQFLGKVQQEFRALLYDRDERALWLFGYWLGLMCRFEGIWWCDARVRRDYKAIRMWLERLHLSERFSIKGKGTVWREMMKELELAPVFIRT